MLAASINLEIKTFSVLIESGRDGANVGPECLLAAAVHINRKCTSAKDHRRPHSQ